MFDLEGSGAITNQTDESCFNVYDIVKYIQYCFAGQNDVPLEDIYCPLKSHPIFPSDGYRPQIKEALKSEYGAKFNIVKNPITGKRETRVSFSKGSKLYE